VNFGFNPYLGARNNRGTIDQPMIGVFSQLAIWKVKLTAGQVTALYAALTATLPGPVTGVSGSSRAVSSAAQGVLTAATQRTGGPGG
jgi:hypothetical protein